ncbi:SDR family oxidoreductase [Lentzea albida]|uniref:SDR family oxidoreductase n=1 Tax=Lentzea albida TaxID=65499 RepID=UPI002481DF09|nr:SDR family oxidoreductase [Lentzea albida]
MSRRRRQFLRKRGRLVMIESVCAQRGRPGRRVHSAAKGAMESATRSLARAWHR